jgi:hypothetical protein
VPRVIIPLGERFNGLDRATAPHLQNPGDSPLTLDADAGDTIAAGSILTARNVLGSRLGRKRTYTDPTGAGPQNIRGVVPFNFTGTVGYGRIASNAAGVWHPMTIPWPGISFDPGQVLFQFKLAPGTLTGIYADLSQFSAWGMNTETFSTNNLDVTLQGQINGAWTTIYDQNSPVNVSPSCALTLAPFPGTGILTGLRVVVNAVGGFSKRAFVLIRGTKLSQTSLS